MRIFGFIGLIAALAIVGLLVTKQLKSVSTISVPSTPSGEAQGQTVREQAQNIQQSVKQAVDLNLQTGVQRREEQDQK
jgi:hypothetical protein